MICDWRISIRFVCFCVSRFIACDGNSVIMIEAAKMQFWRRLLNLKVRVFVKSAVTESTLSSTSLHESSSISFTTTVKTIFSHDQCPNSHYFFIKLHIDYLERKSTLITVGFKDWLQFLYKMFGIVQHYLRNAGWSLFLIPLCWHGNMKSVHDIWCFLCSSSLFQLSELGADHKPHFWQSSRLLH